MQQVDAFLSECDFARALENLELLEKKYSSLRIVQEKKEEIQNQQTAYLQWAEAPEKHLLQVQAETALEQGNDKQVKEVFEKDKKEEFQVQQEKKTAEAELVIGLVILLAMFLLILGFILLIVS